jgi:DNA-binding GntR family transcriptional regulator
VSRGPGRLQAGIMAVMRNHGGYWTAANLAQALLASRSVAATSSVRRALLKLERQGLISAEPAAGGIRFWQLTETELEAAEARGAQAKTPSSRRSKVSFHL